MNATKTLWSALLFGCIAMSACAIDGESDPDAPCGDDEIFFEDDDGDGFCELEEDSGELEAVVNFGTTYIGYRGGYRTYMNSSCARGDGPCSGYQTVWIYGGTNAGAKCYDLFKRNASRSPSGGYYGTSNWKYAYVTDCRR